jgi:hypothetical protein
MTDSANLLRLLGEIKPTEGELDVGRSRVQEPTSGPRRGEHMAKVNARREKRPCGLD